MGLFGRRPKPDAAGYYASGAAAAAVVEGALLPVRIAGREILLTRVANELYAFARRCPHAAGDLCAGGIHRGRVTCPDHGYKFDVATGRLIWPPDELYRLIRHDVRVVGELVYVRLATAC